MEIVKKLGITPEEFLEGFQNYLKSLPGNDEDDVVTILPSGRTVNNKEIREGGLVKCTESHFKNYINILISQNRDDKLDDLLK
jgi:hypothetical protein